MITIMSVGFLMSLCVNYFLFGYIFYRNIEVWVRDVEHHEDDPQTVFVKVVIWPWYAYKLMDERDYVKDDDSRKKDIKIAHLESLLEDCSGERAELMKHIKEDEEDREGRRF